MAAHGMHRCEPLALADPVFEVGAQLLAERGAALLVEAAREAFDVVPGFREFARADGPDRVSLVDRDRRPPAPGFGLAAALAREPGRRPDGDLRNSRYADHFDAGGRRERGILIPRPEALEKAMSSETHYNRLEWRPGKRRRTTPRVHDYGGQKVAPVGLVAARKFVGLNTNAARKCVRIAVSTRKPCRHPAMRGSDYCLSHGGAAAAKRIRPYVRTQPGQQAELRRALEG